MLARDRTIHGWALAGKSQRWIAEKVGRTRGCVQYVLARDVALVAAHGRIALLRRGVARFSPRRRADCEPTTTMDVLSIFPTIGYMRKMKDSLLTIGKGPGPPVFISPRRAPTASDCQACGGAARPQDDECIYCGAEL